VANHGFHDSGPLRQVATNLFDGSGYKFYRIKNQLCADDQLVRSKAAGLLGIAMASVTTAEIEYRREFLPPPTRAKPFPDAVAVAAAQRLERLAHGIGALEALIQQQPVPENDRMAQRLREEAPTLQTLIQYYDEQLVGQCDLLRAKVDRQDSASLLNNLPELEGGLEAIRATLKSRQAVLLDRAR
jgi:hypothetical protein